MILFLLPQGYGFSEVKKFSLKVMIHIFHYGPNANKIRMNGDWFYKTEYADFGFAGKAASRSPADNLTRCIITQSKGFTRKDIRKVNRSV